MKKFIKKIHYILALALALGMNGNMVAMSADDTLTDDTSASDTSVDDTSGDSTADITSAPAKPKKKKSRKRSKVSKTSTKKNIKKIDAEEGGSSSATKADAEKERIAASKKTGKTVTQKQPLDKTR